MEKLDTLERTPQPQSRPQASVTFEPEVYESKNTLLEQIKNQKLRGVTAEKIKEV